MKLFQQCLPIVAILTMAVASVCLAGDDVVWGVPRDGIRVGLAAGSAGDDSAIRVIFENVGSAEAILLIGRSTGLGPIYQLTFTATKPDGQEMRLFIAGPAGVAGMMTPLALHIGSGTSDGIVLPLSKLVAVSGPGHDVSLDTLLRERCSVRVSLEISQGEVDWASTQNRTVFQATKLWTGTAISGEFRRPE